MSSPAPANFDRFVVISVATTTDEHGVYVTKDSAEVIELGWILLDAKTLKEVSIDISIRPIRMNIANVSRTQIARDHVLIKPVNTPITPLCSTLVLHMKSKIDTDDINHS